MARSQSSLEYLLLVSLGTLLAIIAAGALLRLMDLIIADYRALINASITVAVITAGVGGP